MKIIGPGFHHSTSKIINLRKISITPGVDIQQGKRSFDRLLDHSFKSASIPCKFIPQTLQNTRFGIAQGLGADYRQYLENGKLATYKIAGNGPRTTIVLRFDANMADTSVSPIHQSTPLRRKSTNDSKREKERLEHENPPAERIVQQKFGSKTCRETAMNPQIFVADIALHSQSVFDTATCIGLETNKPKHSERTFPTIRYH